MPSHGWIWLVLAIRFVILHDVTYRFTKLHFYSIQNISSEYRSLLHLTRQMTFLECAILMLNQPQRVWLSYNKRNKECVTSHCWAIPVQAQEGTGTIYYRKQDWRCPPNFVRQRSACYWFSTTKGTYDSARSKCKLLGGDLAKITTQEEHDFIRSTATGDYYFLGGTDLRLGGKWAWEGEETEIAYSDWAPGQPSDVSEHCMDLMKSYDYQMNDAPCSDNINFICELRAKC